LEIGLKLKPENIVLWVSLFALMVVTTASLQKLTMDSRDRKLRKLYANERHIKEKTEEFNYSLLDENEELKSKIKQLSEYVAREVLA